jgi:hypothetical protein
MRAKRFKESDVIKILFFNNDLVVAFSFFCSTAERCGF